jgi:hypothetical protein
MAITQTSKIGHVQKLPKSIVQTVSGKFSTTDTTGTIYTTLRRIRSATFTLINSAAIATAEQLTIVGAADAEGFYTVPVSGAVTIGRNYITSGLTFTVRLEGY